MVAEAFYLTRDIEKYGSGFIRVREEIKLYPTMTFEYDESGDGFLVTLRYQNQKISSVSVPHEGISEGISEGVSEGVSSLMDYIKNKPGLRIPELSEQLHVPAKTIERWIKKLRDENRIVFKGAPKTGGYFMAGED